MPHETAEVGGGMVPGTWWASIDTAAAITTLALSLPSLVPAGRQAVAVRGTHSHGIEGRVG